MWEMQPVDFPPQLWSFFLFTANIFLIGDVEFEQA
jgi:hypothetical protein